MKNVVLVVLLLFDFLAEDAPRGLINRADVRIAPGAPEMFHFLPVQLQLRHKEIIAFTIDELGTRNLCRYRKE